MSTKKEASQKWLMFTKCWSCYSKAQADPDKSNTTHMNQVFANCSKEDELYPLTVKEIVEAQNADITLKHLFISNAVLDKGMELQLVKNKSYICNKGSRLVIQKPLQRRAVMWHHHYLQLPGHTHLKETLKAVIYWKGIKHHPIHNKVMQDLPNYYKTYTKIWTPAI
jgi:hypothetical protein